MYSESFVFVLILNVLITVVTPALTVKFPPAVENPALPLPPPPAIVIVFVAPEPEATTPDPTKLSVVPAVDSADPSS